MRRQHLFKFRPVAGYSDSSNVLGENTSYWAEGSCNSLLLGENMIVPFKGFTSKGAATGTQVMVQLADRWGGLKKQSTASGSLIEDASKTLYTIGAGYLSKEGVTMQAYASTPTTISIDPATDVNTGTDTLTENSHGLSTGSQLRYTDDGTVAIGGLTQDTTYFVINTGTNTFKLATSWANAQSGTAIDITSVGTGIQTFTKGVDMTASTLLKVASVQLSNYLYKYFDSAGLARPDAPTLEVPATVGTNYTGFIDGAISFKIGAIRDRNNAGSDLTSIDADVKSVASTTSAVVVPQRKTVKITFPTAVSGQTHWAVFATKVGFGGTGVHYRVGYRTTSAETSTWKFGIAEETVAAATSRTLEFDFKDGDLIPEEAWLYDYAPPAGTHFIRLKNCGVVLGCYDGSVCAVSLPNFLESYHPRHLIYLPEPVTAVMHRLVDDFAYVFCRNSIHVLQYVGFRGDDIPSATISTISPEVGVAYQQNIASGMGRIVAFIDGSGLVMIGDEGQIDYDFGKEVAYLTKSWTASSTVISFDPSTKSFVAANGSVSVSYCLQSGAWGAPVYLTDFGITGNWLSGINSRGELVMTVDNGGTHTAYSYNSGATRTPICSISRWMNANTSARSVNVYEIEASVREGNSTEPIIIGAHQNLFKTFVRGCSVTNSSNIITATGFTANWTGKQVAIFGTNIGGVGTHYLIGKITYASSSTVTLTNRSTGATLNASATLSNCLMLVGEDFEAITPTGSIDEHLYSFYPSIQDARSFAVSVYQPTDASTGALIECDIFGTQNESSQT